VEDSTNHKWPGASAPCYRGVRGCARFGEERALRWERQLAHFYRGGGEGSEGAAQPDAWHCAGSRSMQTQKGLLLSLRQKFLTLQMQTSIINSERISTKYIHWSSGLHMLTYKTTCIFLNNFMWLIYSHSKILIFKIYGETTVGKKNQKCC